MYILDLQQVLEGAPSLEKTSEELEEDACLFKDFVVAEAELPAPEEYNFSSTVLSFCEPTWRNECDITIYVVADGFIDLEDDASQLGIAYVLTFAHIHGMPTLTLSTSSDAFELAHSHYPPSTLISHSGHSVVSSILGLSDSSVTQCKAFSVFRATRSDKPICASDLWEGNREDGAASVERYSGAVVRPSMDDSSVTIYYFD